MSAAARKPRPVVLVAEDDEDILEMVVFDLEDEGFEVLTARDGDAAVALALERRPDLVLLDVAMPGLDGYEVTRRATSGGIDPRDAGRAADGQGAGARRHPRVRGRSERLRHQAVSAGGAPDPVAGRTGPALNRGRHAVAARLGAR